MDHKGSGGNRYDREGGWMYSYALPEKAPDARCQLYNLESDPGEMVNLYDDPSNEILVQDLKSRLGELQYLYQVP